MLVFLAIGLPWWFGYLLVRVLNSNNTLEDRFIAIGYGYFLGCLLIFILCWCSSVYYSLNIKYALSVLFVINVTLMRCCNKEMMNLMLVVKDSVKKLIKSTDNKIKIGVLIATIWMLLRLSSLGAEIILQPLYPWDAYTSWLAKARLWYLSDQILPMIDHWAWMGEYNMPKRIYVHGSAGERSYLSYLTLWLSLAVGQWDEGISLLSWLMAIVAIMFGMIGQLRAIGLPSIMIVISALILLLIPILDSHIALPGYADLWVAAFVVLGVASLYHWAVYKNNWQFVLSLMMILSCYLVKSQSGTIWACLLLVALLLAYYNIKTEKVVLALIVGCLGGGMLVVIGVDIGDPLGVHLVINSELLKIPYLFNSETPKLGDVIERSVKIIKHLYWYGSWGLFWYVFSFFVLFRSRVFLKCMPPSIVFFVLSSLMIIFIYIFMVNYISVPIDTVINRAFLHVVPSYVYVMTVLVARIDVLNENN